VHTVWTSNVALKKLLSQRGATVIDDDSSSSGLQAPGSASMHQDGSDNESSDNVDHPDEGEPVCRSTQAASSTLVSKGSAAHAANRCQPCAFILKKLHCARGSECLYCHLTHDGPASANRKYRRGNKERRRYRKFMESVENQMQERGKGEEKFDTVQHRQKLISL